MSGMGGDLFSHPQECSRTWRANGGEIPKELYLESQNEYDSISLSLMKVLVHALKIEPRLP